MRRRLSLTLLAFLLIVAVVSQQYLSHRTRARRDASAGTRRDSLGRLDSASRADSVQAADTLCFASRIGLPCDPR